MFVQTTNQWHILR